MMQKGFTHLLIVAIIAVIGIAGVGYGVMKGSSESSELNIRDDQVSPTEIPTTQIPTPSEAPTNTPTPTVTPTKQVIPTKKVTTTAVPTVQPSNDCSKFNPDDGLSYITINLKEKNGEAMLGDWVVKIKPTGDCPGILPGGSAERKEVIRQPNYSWTTPGLHPGQFRIDVNYHYTGKGIDFDATSGNHNLEVEVEN